MSDLAEDIARALFIGWQGEEAERLKHIGPDGRDLGGWSFMGAYGRIRRVLDRRPESAAGALADALEGLLAHETSSYCEYCCNHAPKGGDGALLGPVAHAGDCPVPPARAALRAAGRSS